MYSLSSQNQNQTQPTNLKYRLIESTSEDPEHPLHEILKGDKGHGWQSVRYCQYPQDIIIQFSQPVNLKQIKMLIHEKIIPSQVKFFAFVPKTTQDYTIHYKHAPFDYVGFIKMSSNVRTNYTQRESMKVVIDINCLYLKLVIEKNYVNRHNNFNQVSLMGIEFRGMSLPFDKNSQMFLNEGLKQYSISDEDLEGICDDKLKELKGKMEVAIKEERYEDCKVIKGQLERVRMIGKKIFTLENQKRIAVNNEDFDSAKVLKDQAERMRVTLSNFDKPKLNTISNDDNTIKNEGVIEEENINEINDNIDDIPINKATIQSVSHNKGISTNGGSMLNIKPQSKFNEEDFLDYDEIIIPTVLKKMNNESSFNNETESGIAIKGDLEELPQSILTSYSLIIKLLGEETLRKLFSKQILWKEEGFDILHNKLSEMFKNCDDINTLITLIMKLIMTFLEDKHPSTCIKTLDIAKALFDCIKLNRTNLNIDVSITDQMLTKIKSKVGDVSAKIRSKAVELYCFMLTLEFCDYHNLISELIEEELKHVDSKYVQKSSKLILGKMEIFNMIFDDLKNAISAKRTDYETFPSALVASYLVMNVTHNKSEIRKMTRFVIGKFIREFGVKKIGKKLEKIDMRELSKLISEIPELGEWFNSQGLGIGKDNKTMLKYNHNSSSFDMSVNPHSNTSLPAHQAHRSPRHKTRTKTYKSRSKSKSRSNSPQHLQIQCQHCQKVQASQEALKEHINTDCLLYTNCCKCSLSIEIRRYTSHMLSECKYKEDFKVCKRCKEAVEAGQYNTHVGDNNCNPAKNPNSSNRCPLCHKDIPPGDKGFFTHHMKDKCPKNKRKTN